MSAILAVDDNSSNLELLDQIFGARQHCVRVATSGQRALDSARIAPPDLILLDITMPEMDGYETCQRFKADPILANIPIIFISALDDPLDKVKAFSVGGADYITKPFQAEEVLARADHQLRITALERELRIQNQQLEASLSQLKLLNEEKSRFLGIVAHDLRNPLHSILLLVEINKEEPDLQMIRSREERICQEVWGLNKLVDRFLNLEALESGQVKPELEEIDVIAVLESARDRFKDVASKKKIVIDCDFQDTHPMVWADAAFVREVFDNLVSNAVKFSLHGKSVVLRVMSLEKDVVISVEDHGPGLTVLDRENLFKRYVKLSAKPTGGEKSTGLGLSIVKSMVEAMGGRIWVDGELGQGAAFRVSLPLVLG